MVVFLSSRLLKDPFAFEVERTSLRIDGIGITLIASVSAALEVALARGQIDDWFGSPFICWTLATPATNCPTTAFLDHVLELQSRK
jgi:MFS transporter, DHA2 family, multidrug resistance protein